MRVVLAIRGHVGVDVVAARALDRRAFMDGVAERLLEDLAVLEAGAVLAVSPVTRRRHACEFGASDVVLQGWGETTGSAGPREPLCLWAAVVCGPDGGPGR